LNKTLNDYENSKLEEEKKFLFKQEEIKPVWDKILKNYLNNDYELYST
jgi:hypothetical protein